MVPKENGDVYSWGIFNLTNTLTLQGSLEEQLGRLREYEEAVYQFKPHLEELERINQQIQESFVFENRYTQYTMETLRVGWEQLVTSVNRTINEVENQVCMHGRIKEGLNQFVNYYQIFLCRS